MGGGPGVAHRDRGRPSGPCAGRLRPDAPIHRRLERKDLYSLAEFSERDVVAAGFLDRYADACERAQPLMAFLTKALGLRW